MARDLGSSHREREGIKSVSVRDVTERPFMNKTVGPGHAIQKKNGCVSIDAF